MLTPTQIPSRVGTQYGLNANFSGIEDNYNTLITITRGVSLFELYKSQDSFIRTVDHEATKLGTYTSKEN